MAITPTNPIAGSAQTGFTSPTYTITEDNPPNGHSEQWAITGIGGTQPSDVTASTVSVPFTVTVERPASFRAAPTLPTNGILGNVPRNVYKVRTRKGVIPVAGQAAQTMLIETKFSVPAGVDVADPDNMRAAVSAHVGLIDNLSASIGNLAVYGVL